MTVIVNPFDAGGFTLAEMSAAIQMLPNPYGRVGQLGLFAPEPISQRNVTIESIEGELRLLPAVAPGAPATVGTTDKRSVRSFAVAGECAVLATKDRCNGRSRKEPRECGSVRTLAAKQLIVTRTTDQGIVAVATCEGIIACATQE